MALYPKLGSDNAPRVRYGLAVVRLSFYFIFISTMNTNVYNFCGTAVTCLENTLGE